MSDSWTVFRPVNAANSAAGHRTAITVATVAPTLAMLPKWLPEPCGKST